MEFPFSVNDVLPDRVTCVDGTLLPDAFKNADKETVAECQHKIAFMLDEIGLSSGIAQGLQSPVTSADRLRDTDHRIYLLTNPSGAGGKGTLVGLLKIGRKKLYIFDHAGKHHELTPICVLDFYVHETMQRNGCGRMLYEHMLQEENIAPEFLALDRPSEKLTGFLKKHYNLVHIIPQSNNFVVYDRFFSADPGLLPGYKSCAVFDKKRAAGKGSHSVARAHGRALVSRPTCAMDKMMEPKSNGETDSPPHEYNCNGRYAASLIAEDTPDGDAHGNNRLEHQRLW